LVLLWSALPVMAQRNRERLLERHPQVRNSNSEAGGDVNSFSKDSVFPLGTHVDANLENRTELARLVEEQAALRRVATLVARGAAPAQVFTAVTEEAGRLFGAHLAGLGRYEGETVAVLAGWSATNLPHRRVPVRWPLGGGDLASTVFRTGHSVRIATYQDIGGPIAAFVRDELGIDSSIASPIAVEGRPWGVLFLHAKDGERPLSQDAEFRLTAFSELVAAAIANTESRADVARLAEEQAALRRVATLVAGRTAPEQLFAAVTEEIGSLFDVDWANMARYEPDNTVTFVATWSRTADRLPVGSRWTLGGHNLATLVFETRHSARIDNFVEAQGPLEVTVRDAGIRSGVGSPIIVDGSLWGVVGAGAVLDQLPPDTEERLASFTELVAMAVANTESRAQLKMSRARIVNAADKARQQIERDLHDGTQQQLVSLMLELRAAEANQQADVGDMRKKLTRTAQALDGVLEELREISRGIHPAILSKAGLEPALKTLARRSALPVELDLRTDRRPPEHVEVAAYFAVCEALANAAKHSQASVVTIALDMRDSNLQLSVHDDGIGGADPNQGTGLVGLADRIEALGGRLEITSPAGSGTLLSLEIPIDSTPRTTAS